MDSIRISSLRVDCIVGIYPSERTVSQPLDIELELFMDTREASRGGGLKDSIDYACLCGEVRFLLQSCRFVLLEEAAEALARYILCPLLESLPRACVEGVRVAVSKPNALNGAAIPTICISRKRDEYQFAEEVKEFGRVDIVYENNDCGIYRLRIGPQNSIPLHIHREMDEYELVMTNGLLLQGYQVLPGSAFNWPLDFPHTYENLTTREQVILCVDRPRFDPGDEIEVPVPELGLSILEPTIYYPAESRVYDQS